MAEKEITLTGGMAVNSAKALYLVFIYKKE
jgi:hypothetical protein